MDNSDCNKAITKINNEINAIQNDLTETFMRLEKSHFDLVMAIDPTFYGKLETVIDCSRCADKQ